MISIPDFKPEKVIINIHKYCDLFPEQDDHDEKEPVSNPMLRGLEVHSSYFVPENVIILKDSDNVIAIFNLDTGDYMVIDKENKMCAAGLLQKFSLGEKI